MEMVNLSWREVEVLEGRKNFLCEIRARNSEDALIMEVQDRGRTLLKKEYSVTAYYWIPSPKRNIPLYDNLERRGLDDSMMVLSQWYLKNAPTLLTTLAR